MKFTYTRRFKKAYKALDKRQQRQVKKAIKLMDEDIGHPSLRVEKVEGARGEDADIWAARASRSIRITFERIGDRIFLRNVGEHNSTLERP